MKYVYMFSNSKIYIFLADRCEGRNDKLIYNSTKAKKPLIHATKNLKYVSFAFFTVYGFAIAYYTSVTDLMLMVCFYRMRCPLVL